MNTITLTRELSALRIAVWLMLFLVFSCSKENSQKDNTMESRTPSFEEQRKLLLESKNEYEAVMRWNALYKKIDQKSATEIQKWLELQKLILTDWTSQYPNGTIRRLAIQEFRLWGKHIEPFRRWLEDCKQRNLFKDPFIVQNLNLAIDKLHKYQRQTSTFD